MSGVTDRLTPEDIEVIAAVIFAERQRMSREQREAEERNRAAIPATRPATDDHHDLPGSEDGRRE